MEKKNWVAECAAISKTRRVLVSRIRHSLNRRGNLQEDGGLNLNGSWFNYTQYCVATIENDTSYYRQAYVCVPTVLNPDVEAMLRIGRQAMPVLYGISLVFLVLSLVHVYRRSRHKLFGIMTLSMLAMLSGFFVFILVPHLAGPSHVRGSPVLCQLEGFFIQFFYLSSMCWLNSMCFDVWTTFRQLRKPKTSVRSRLDPKFKWYALWSWGFPGFVVLFTVTMQYLPEEVTDGLPVPNVGKNSCFLDKDGAIYYLHGVNLPILLANVLLFTFSSWKLCCGIWSAEDLPRGTDYNKSKFRSRARTLTKLFFVVGITWIAEVASYLLHNLEGGSSATVMKISFTFDCLNAGQGLIMFVVLVCDSATINRIKGATNSVRNMRVVTIRTRPTLGASSSLPATTGTSEVQLTELYRDRGQLSMRSLSSSFRNSTTTTVNITDKKGQILSKVYHV